MENEARLPDADDNEDDEELPAPVVDHIMVRQASSWLLVSARQEASSAVSVMDLAR